MLGMPAAIWGDLNSWLLRRWFWGAPNDLGSTAEPRDMANLRWVRAKIIQMLKNQQVCWLNVNICIMKHESDLTKVYTNTYKYQEVQNKPKSWWWLVTTPFHEHNKALLLRNLKLQVFLWQLSLEQPPHWFTSLASLFPGWFNHLWSIYVHEWVILGQWYTINIPLEIHQGVSPRFL